MHSTIFCEHKYINEITKIKSAFDNILDQYIASSIITLNFTNDSDINKAVSGIQLMEDGCSLFLTGVELTSCDMIIGLGMNKPYIEKVLANSQYTSNQKYNIIKRYYECIIAAIRLYDSSQNYNNMRIFFFDKNMDISYLLNQIDYISNLFLEITGGLFPNNINDQIAFFIKFLYKKWNNKKNTSYRNDHAISSDAFYIWLIPHNLDSTINMNVAFSRKSFNCYFPYALNEIDKELYIRIEQLEFFYKNCLKIHIAKFDKEYFIYDIRPLNGNELIYLKTLIEMKNQGVISSKSLLCNINPVGINKYLASSIMVTDKENAKKDCRLIGVGKGASPFSAVGKVCFSTSIDNKESDILIKEILEPDDLDLINNVQGVITSSGSATSHPSVVLRQMGKAFICGLDGLIIKQDHAIYADNTINENDIISMDGVTGEIFKGILRLTQDGSSCSEVQELIQIAKMYKSIRVLTNCEHIGQAQSALKYKCDGVGLYRMEFMRTRVPLKKLIKSYLIENNANDKLEQLAIIHDSIKEELISFFDIMKNKEVTIRTIDYPMHELLNDNVEYNPMLGNRGARLSILEPELFKMQIKAIFSAFSAINKEIELKILLPMIADANEILILREYIADVIGDGYKGISIGSMVETPRALFTIEDIASKVDFLSFGTNDLTQMIWGISRDDSYQFLPQYINKEIIAANPFQYIDIEGVYNPIKLAIHRVRKNYPQMDIGFCGEQLSDLNSLNLFLNLPINYVSVIPQAIPQTLIACGQYNIYNENMWNE